MDYLEKWLIFYNEAKNLALLTIAKNCSESIKQGVTKDFVYYDTIDLPKDTTAIVIFRDPYDRWISGTVEYFAYPESVSYLSTSEHGVQLNLQQWLNREPMPWDYHTSLQSVVYNYSNLDLKPYWFCNSVLEDINKDYNCFDEILVTHQGKLRKKYKKIIKEFINKNQKVVESKLSTLYNVDYKFFNTLKFVNRNVATCL